MTEAERGHFSALTEATIHLEGLLLSLRDCRSHAPSSLENLA